MTTWAPPARGPRTLDQQADVVIEEAVVDPAGRDPVVRAPGVQPDPPDVADRHEEVCRGQVGLAGRGVGGVALEEALPALLRLVRLTEAASTTEDRDLVDGVPPSRNCRSRR